MILESFSVRYWNFTGSRFSDSDSLIAGMGLLNAGDSACCRRCDKCGILREHAGGVAWRRCFPTRHAAGDFGVGNLDFEFTSLRIDADAVAFMNRCDWAAQ